MAEEMAGSGQLAGRIEALAAFVRSAPPPPALRDAYAALRRDEIAGSAQLAGAALDLVEVRALLERGRAVGGHRLHDYLPVSGYAEAAAWSAQQGARRNAVTSQDLRTLHRLATRATPDDRRAGRHKTMPPLA